MVRAVPPARAGARVLREDAEARPRRCAGAGVDRLPERPARPQERRARDVRPPGCSFRPATPRRTSIAASCCRSATITKARWRPSSRRSRSIPITIARSTESRCRSFRHGGSKKPWGRSRKNTKLQPMSPYGWYQLARVQHDLGQARRNAEGARPPGEVRAEGRAPAGAGDGPQGEDDALKAAADGQARVRLLRGARAIAAGERWIYSHGDSRRVEEKKQDRARARCTVFSVNCSFREEIRCN